VLVVILLSRSRPPDTRTKPRSVLMLLDLESRDELPSPERKPETRSAAHPRKSPSAGPRESSGKAIESTAASPGKADVIPKIDWDREIQSVIPKIIAEYVRRCAEAARTHAPRPPGCNRRSYDGPWRPSGNQLLDMRDPDRPRSSVPDPLPPAFPEAPRSVVFKNEE